MLTILSFPDLFNSPRLFFLVVQIGSRTLKTLLRHHEKTENVPDVCKYTTATVKDETNKQFSKIIYKQICQLTRKKQVTLKVAFKPQKNFPVCTSDPRAKKKTCRRFLITAINQNKNYKLK